MKRVFCVCTEASGDLLLSKCIQAIQAHQQPIEWIGIVGPLCAALGLKVLMDARTLNGHGFIEVLPIIPRALMAKRLIESYLDEIDLVILCDSPELNLRIIPKLDQKNIPYVYLAPPQIWAWRSHRIKILSNAKAIGCLFPFEQAFYQKSFDQSLPQASKSVFQIGHPMLDHIESLGYISSPINHYQNRISNLKTSDSIKIALFPGSRKSSFQQLIKQMLKIASISQALLENNDLPQVRDLNQRKMEWHICISPWLPTDFVDKILKQNLKAKYPQLHLIFHKNVKDCIDSTHFALSCIGSVNLEIALVGMPQICLSPLQIISDMIAKTFANVPFASLINLCLNRKAFDEFYLPQIESQQIASLLLAQVQQMLENKSKSHQQAFEALPKSISKLDFSDLIMEIFHIISNASSS
jgi:lipid-A-disaccharide synthase